MGNILICDDERSICEMLDITLRRDGHKVETVTGGEAGKRKIDSAIFDVIVDLRENSPTRHRWVGMELSAQNRRGLYVPKEFAHGFLTLTDDAEVLYMMSVSYVPGSSDQVPRECEDSQDPEEPDQRGLIHTPGGAFRRSHRAPGEEEFRSAPLADDPRQDSARAHVGAGEADAGEQEGRLRFRRRISDVGGHREDRAGAGADSLDRGHDRLGTGAHRLHQIPGHPGEGG